MTFTSLHPISTRFDSVRLGLLYFVALSASLGTAVSAIGRLLLYLVALVYLVGRASGRDRTSGAVLPSPLSWAVLLAVAYMALSVLWSAVGPVEALWSWSRHARLLTILIMLCLITSLAEARAVLRVFVWGQLFVVLSAWMLVFKLPVPWATGAGQGSYAVYSSYLEQGISQAVLVALLWFQRDHVFGPRGRWLALSCAVATAVLTIGLMPGRSGHMVLLGLLTFALFHYLPRRFRWAVLVAPLLAVLLMFQLSSAFRERTNLVVSEVALHQQGSAQDTSTGTRLEYWRASARAVAEQPLAGHGAGSWNQAYRRLKGPQASKLNDTVSDPHQLFLLWAVEGGLLGLALLCAVLAALWRYGRGLAANDGHALQAMVLALVISGLFNSMIYGIGMGDFFCIGLGILVALGRDSGRLPGGQQPQR
jgi:O-antigen ligase